MKVELKKYLPSSLLSMEEFVNSLANPLLAAILGILTSMIFLAFLGYDPISFIRALLVGSVGSRLALASSIARAVPIMLTGLSFAVAARAKLFNIGAEGQFYMGALMAVVLGAYISVWSPIHILLILIVSFVVGALWALPAAVLKIYRGVNEVISTIMLNWIAYHFVMYMVGKVIYNPDRPYKSVSVNQSATFPHIFTGTDLTYSIFIAMVFAVLTYIYMWLTVDGFEIRAVGYNPNAAKYAGIDINKALLKAMLVSGGLAGLGGALHIMSTSYYITGDLSNLLNLGFDGITVSLLGRNHPLGIILSAIFMGGLKASNTIIQIQAGIPKQIVYIAQGIIIMFIAIPSIIDLFFKRIKPEELVEEVE